MSAQNDTPPGASGNFNFDQHGGTTNQYYVNQAPPKLQFTKEVGDLLLANIPKDQPITVDAIGSPSDQQVGAQIANFLASNGYKVAALNFVMIGMPQDKPIRWDVTTHTLYVAPAMR
ncbi:MAG TPA: hypothetical protein VND19_10935 [Acetobacteraceae bacterium]|nr:hypothetical protein [Acetobacteraceae bacterium]